MKKILLALGISLVASVAIGQSTQCPRIVTCTSNWYTSCSASAESVFMKEAAGFPYETKPGVYQLTGAQFSSVSPYEYNDCDYENENSRIRLRSKDKLSPLISRGSKWQWQSAAMDIAYCTGSAEECNFIKK
jgi:hypothetical protein